MHTVFGVIVIILCTAGLIKFAEYLSQPTKEEVIPRRRRKRFRSN